MRAGQLIRFAVGGLWRQKVRTTLTLVGVTVGTTALTFSLALGLGLRAFIDREFTGRPDFWRVVVRPAEPIPDAAELPDEVREKVEVREEMSEERRARMKEARLDKALAQGFRAPPALLTPERVNEIAALPDVAEVRTFRTAPGKLWLGGKGSLGLVAAGRLNAIEDRLIAGRLPASDDADEVVVSELTLYELGVRSDAQIEAFLGSEVRLDAGGVRTAVPASLARALSGRTPEELTETQERALAKLAGRLPAALDRLGLTAEERAAVKAMLEPKAGPTPVYKIDPTAVARGTYRVVGVIRVITREDRKKADPFSPRNPLPGDVFLPPGAGERLFLQLPWARKMGYLAAEVWVRPGGDLAGTVAAVEAMKLHPYSALKWFGAAKREVTLIAAGLNLFALIALFVAGIGITNTLVTSVVERTREIGILKAVGATRGQVLGIFLLEGAVIGLVGSGLGLGLGRLLAIPADRWTHNYIEKQISGEKLITESVFLFPWWLWLGAVAFAVVLTTAAAFYPARRAARIDPIQALKYE